MFSKPVQNPLSLPRLSAPMPNDRMQVSLAAPEMPLPGPDFGRMIFGENFEMRTSKSKKVQEAELELRQHVDLNSLYNSVLYHPGQPIRLQHKSKFVDSFIVPGHQWFSSIAGPVPNLPKPVVMVVGRFPGKDEQRTLRNFTGPSGELLRTQLDKLFPDGEYANWYITNIIKFPPPEMTTQAVPKDWLKDCAPILDMELRIVQPDFILCLGAEATSSILGRGVQVVSALGKAFDFKYPIDQEEIEEDEEPNYKTARVVCCVHPAAVLRKPEQTQQFFTALRSFRDLLFTGDIGSNEKELHHVDHPIVSRAELRARVQRIISDPDWDGVLAFDAEWHGDRPHYEGSYIRTIQVAWKPKHAMAIKLHEAGGAEAFLPNIKSAFTELALLFGNVRPNGRRVRLVGHNMKADIEWLQEHFKNVGFDLLKAAAPPDHKEGEGKDTFGPYLTRIEGGFDTMLAAHAVNETTNYKLEILSAQWLGLPRYDGPLQEWKKTYCADHKLKADDLEGYGPCEDNVLVPYGSYDSDATIRLFYKLNGRWKSPTEPIEPGYLDADPSKDQECRLPFWIAMKALPGFLEMEQTGLCIDMDRAKELHKRFQEGLSNCLCDFRASIKWPKFNPASTVQCRELLFNEALNGKKTLDGTPTKVRPDEALSFNLTPIKTTGKPAKPWEVALNSSGTLPAPAVDKEVLGILSFTEPRVKHLLDIKFLQQVLKTMLREPTVQDDGEEVFEDGFLCYAHKDDDGQHRIRTRLYPTLETGRTSSSKPNLTNIGGKRREKDYKRILGALYVSPLRSIVRSSPETVLIEADYIGAELAIAAWMSDDPAMKDHVRRMQLPEDHPDYFDMHANIACRTFGLSCAPTKAGLEEAGLIHLRVAAKTVLFGSLYQQGAESAARKANEEGAKISVEQAQELINEIFTNYSALASYMQTCMQRPYIGSMKNCFGRVRRFEWSSDRQTMNEQGRQACNFPIQSAVADAISIALSNLTEYKEQNPSVRFKIPLQIHDAILLEVPINQSEMVYDQVLPLCMSEQVPIWPTDLDGNPLLVDGRPAVEEPYHLGIDRSVMLRWGEKITKKEATSSGIPARFAAKQ